MQDLSDIDYRMDIINEILGPENLRRKLESYERREIAKNRHAQYILRKLICEFPKTHAHMRKVMSINPAPRLLDERAALYKEAPERQITHADGTDLTDAEQEQIDNLYLYGRIDQKMKLANWIYELQDQVELQVVPSDGAITLRAYHPHQLDVVPDEINPDKAYAYVVSTFQNTFAGRRGGDGIDEKIADVNDGQSGGARAKMRFVMWTDDLNFLCDGNGKILTSPDDQEVGNPVGALPFIDVTFDRDSTEFWNRTGSPLCDFVVDLGVMLSDAAETGRLQNFGQGVMASHEKPETLNVGPNQVLWLQLDDSRTQQPSFSFASPNGNQAATLEFIKATLSMLQTTEGVDPKTINSSGEAKNYKSGWDRMLAMVERFDESKDVMDMFEHAEESVFRLLVQWSNIFQNTKNSPLRQELLLSKLPEDLSFNVTFYKPQVLQSIQEEQDSHIKLVDAGFESKVMAIMELKDFDEDQAIEYCLKINEHNKLIGEIPLDQLVEGLPGQSVPGQPAKPGQPGQVAPPAAAAEAALIKNDQAAYHADQTVANREAN